MSSQTLLLGFLTIGLFVGFYLAPFGVFFVLAILGLVVFYPPFLGTALSSISRGIHLLSYQVLSHPVPFSVRYVLVYCANEGAWKIRDLLRLGESYLGYLGIVLWDYCVYLSKRSLRYHESISVASNFLQNTILVKIQKIYFLTSLSIDSWDWLHKSIVKGVVITGPGFEIRYEYIEYTYHWTHKWQFQYKAEMGDVWVEFMDNLDLSKKKREGNLGLKTPSAHKTVLGWFSWMQLDFNTITLKMQDVELLVRGLRFTICKQPGPIEADLEWWHVLMVQAE